LLTAGDPSWGDNLPHRNVVVVENGAYKAFEELANVLSLIRDVYGTPRALVKHLGVLEKGFVVKLVSPVLKGDRFPGLHIVFVASEYSRTSHYRSRATDRRYIRKARRLRSTLRKGRPDWS